MVGIWLVQLVKDATAQYVMEGERVSKAAVNATQDLIRSQIAALASPAFSPRECVQQCVAVQFVTIVAAVTSMDNALALATPLAIIARNVRMASG